MYFYFDVANKLCIVLYCNVYGLLIITIHILLLNPNLSWCEVGVWVAEQFSLGILAWLYSDEFQGPCSFIVLI